MNPMMFLTRRKFRKKKEQDPKEYQRILDYTCPETWGLPSYHDTRSCWNHSCEQCWKEALGNDNCIENKKAEEG